jgi:hypothetical protein
VKGIEPGAAWKQVWTGRAPVVLDEVPVSLEAILIAGFDLEDSFRRKPKRTGMLRAIE